MASSNTLLTPTIIAKEALLQVLNNRAMSAHVYTAYKNEFVKVGTSITIRKPNKFRTTKTQARANSNISEPSTTMTMATQAHVSWAFSSVDLTTTIADYSKRYITPAAETLGNTLDYDLCGLYADVYNVCGSAGTTPNTFKVLGDGQQVMDEEGAPSGKRIGILNPAANWALADGLKGTFAARVADDIITKGYLGTIANLDLYMDQNVNRVTTGTYTAGATPLVNTTSVTGDTTLITKGWNGTSNTVAVGDVFTISGVYAVNPMSGASTGVLRRFVVTEANTSNTTMTIKISPTIKYAATIALGSAYNTVDSLPQANASITFLTGTQVTAYPQNLLFCPNAFALVTVPIEMPANVWGARETDKESGMSIRVVKQYDIDADEEIIRLDILYGTKTLYPELACRLLG
jgi:hypothetical protein